MNSSFHQIYVHFGLVELHILIVDWQNIVEVLELMHYYFFDDELNEHLIILNQHIEQEKNFLLDQFHHFEARDKNKD